MPSQSSPKPADRGHFQQLIIALLFCSTLINYLDRQTLSTIAPVLRDQLSLTNVQYSHIVFAFLLGYTVSQILAGRLIDRVGTRNGMLLCVAAWSVAAMLHGLAVGVLSFCAARFLLGVAEAGNWPGAVKAVSENFSPERRAFAVGVFNSGSALGAIIAPPLVVAVVKLWGWRPMFAVVGATGFIWIWLWRRHYKTSALRPGQSVKAPAIQLPALSYLRFKSIWGLMIGRFFADPIWWFYAFWLPEYLVRNRGFSLTQIGKLVWIPFVFGALGNLAGGFASGFAIRYLGSPVRARKVVMIGGAFLMLSGIPAFYARSSTAALVWISIVLFGYSSWASNILSLPADLFASEEVAQVTGWTGTAGATGGMLFTLATGWLVENISYEPVFGLACGMILCASAAINFLVPHHSLPRSPNGEGLAEGHSL